MEERPIPEKVERRLNGWFTTFWVFTICHYLFGIGGVLASTIVAATAKTDPETARIAGIISAICIAIIGFIKPEEKYRKHVIAWRILDEKVNLYRHGLIEIKDLILGMALAEKTLDQIEREAGNLREPNLATQGINNNSATGNTKSEPSEKREEKTTES
jgi:hypothetical protein